MGGIPIAVKSTPRCCHRRRRSSFNIGSHDSISRLLAKSWSKDFGSIGLAITPSTKRRRGSSAEISAPQPVTR
jgi:hypothetical protein